MNHTILSENLKKFRLEKGFTQEEVAGRLRVNAQTVSRWECGTSMPDVLLLPDIAELYGVTIDALYRKSSIAYENYAQRLASVYEYTGSPEDFLRADLEFQKLIKAGELSTRDKLAYAYIFHEMLFYCKEKALEWYDKGIADGPLRDPENYSRCRSLRIALLGALGQGDELLAEQLQRVAEQDSASEWQYLIEIYIHMNQYDRAYAAYAEAIAKYPDDWKLSIFGAECCVHLQRYDEALALYHRAGELGTDLHDDLCGMAWCYDRMGDYEKAIAEQTRLHDLYLSEGFEYEAKMCLDAIKRLTDKAREQPAKQD